MVVDKKRTPTKKMCADGVKISTAETHTQAVVCEKERTTVVYR